MHGTLDVFAPVASNWDPRRRRLNLFTSAVSVDVCEGDVDNSQNFLQTETYVKMKTVCELNSNTIYYLFTSSLLVSSDTSRLYKIFIGSRVWWMEFWR